MKQVVIPWTNGTGNITLTFTGQGNDTVIVASDDNSLDVARSQAITVKTADGSVRRTVIVTQEAGSHSQPYDAEIEYLEIPSLSNDTYLVDLGFKVHKDDVLVVDFWIEDNNNPCQITLLNGSSDYYNGNHNFHIIRFVSVDWTQNYTKVRCADRWLNNQKTVKMFSLGQRHTISINLPYNQILCDGTTMINPCGNNTLSSTLYDTNGYMNQNLEILRFSNSSVVTTDTKLYSLKISGHNNVDLIPVRVGQVGYMYDKVSGQLFGNSGTGNFILGPDIQ